MGKKKNNNNNKNQKNNTNYTTKNNDDNSRNKQKNSIVVVSAEPVVAPNKGKIISLDSNKKTKSSSFFSWSRLSNSLICFVAGIFTPPLMHYWWNNTTASATLSSSSSFLWNPNINSNNILVIEEESTSSQILKENMTMMVPKEKEIDEKKEVSKTKSSTSYSSLSKTNDAAKEKNSEKIVIDKEEKAASLPKEEEKTKISVSKEEAKKSSTAGAGNSNNDSDNSSKKVVVDREKVLSKEEETKKSSTSAAAGTNNNNDKTVKVIQQQRDCNPETSTELMGYVTEKGVRGMHTLCFYYDKENRSKIRIFRDSISREEDIIELERGSKAKWSELKDMLSFALKLDQRRYPIQAWALFSHEGRRLADELFEDKRHDPENRLIPYLFSRTGYAVVMEGGQWFWPGVHEGYIRQIMIDDKTNATLQTLSLQPLVLSVEGFLTDEECTYIQDTATPLMRYSDVTLMDKDKGRPASDFRTSQSTFLGGPGNKYPTLNDIDHRTAELVRIPRVHQEYVQVLRYGHTEKYNAHHDYFDPKLYTNDPNTLRTIQNGKKNRLATVFWYLSTVPNGGETIFPRYGGKPPPRRMADCSTGLKVKPKRGKVIIFYSMTPEGTIDPYSLHGACPVGEGGHIKWAANKWVWNQPTGFYR